MYGRQMECAIAAMSRLAEVYNDERNRISASEIADVRGLSRPFVAKILSTLSQAGLVNGSRGPGGGFALARSPSQIRLLDVYQLFERDERSATCPFGGGVCGEGESCALHEKLVAVRDAMDELLQNTTFEDFRRFYEEREKRPTAPPPSSPPTDNE